MKSVGITNMRIKIILTLLTLVSIAITISDLLLLKTYISMGYKIDIYSQLPSIFWYARSIVYFIGCILTLQSMREFKLIGIITLLINYSIILFVPYELGYYSYGRGDELTHIGWIKDIILTGHTSATNIYPATHIFIGILSLISAINPNICALLLPFLFSMLFVIGIFIFTKSFISKVYKNTLYLVIPASVIYYCGWLHFTILPNFIFFILIPMIFFVLLKYLKNKNISISTVLVIFLIIIPFGHPFVNFFITYILFLFILREYILNKKVLITNPFIISLLVFAAWFIYNVAYMNSFRRMYYAFINSLTKPVIAKGLEEISKINLTGIEFIKFISVYYGRYIIPLFFVLFLLLYLTRNFFLEKKILLRENHIIKDRWLIRNGKKDPLSSLILLLMLSGIFQLILIFNTFLSHTPHRMFDLNYIVFSLVPLFAFSLYKLFLKDTKKIGVILITIILTSTFTLSFFGAFDSPYIYRPNQETTYNEVVGANWLLSEKDEKPIYDTFGFFGYRFSSLFLVDESEKGKKGDILHFGKVEDHFGYNESKYFNEKDRYIVITTFGELLYRTVFKEVGRYNATDFEKFRNDPNVIKIYDSLDIEIYMS